ncbi:hypothetical protein HaLaN_15301, partial [Haematococcus lacustris]
MEVQQQHCMACLVKMTRDLGTLPHACRYMIDKV